MKVLIVKLSSLGDIIHSFPAISELYKNNKELEIDWVVEEAFIEMPCWHYAINHIHSISIRRWYKKPIQSIFNREWNKWLPNLRSKKYDMIIDIQGLIKSAIISKLAKSTYYCGYDFKSIREKPASFLFNKKIFVPKNMHAIYSSQTFMANLFKYTPNFKNLNFGISEYFKLNNKNKENTILLLHQSSKENKLWNKNNWAQLANILHNSGYQPLVSWGSEKELIYAKELSILSKHIEVLPRMSISELSVVISKSKGVVGVDTGFTHLSSALNIPTIALFGPTNPDLASPVGDKQATMSLWNDQPDEIAKKLISLIK